MHRLIQPIDHITLRIENDAAPPVRPAHVRNGHEERGRQAVKFSNLAAADSELSRETHRTDIQRVRLFQDATLEFGEYRIGIRVLNRAQKLALGEVVT